MSVVVDSSAAAPSRPLEGLALLLAEDTAISRRLYETVLQSAGAEVISAPDGVSAFRAWEESSAAGHPINAAVLDFGLPYLNGAALAAMLRAAGFRGPVVGLTAGVGAAEAALWRECGCDFVMSKDAPRKELVARLAAYPRE